MLWVDQPVGTGYSTGTPIATSQYETAQEFIKFFKNWQLKFGIEKYKIYVTGESYAGRYVPYISAAMLNQNDTQYFNLSGALTYDPCIGDFNSIQEEYVAYPFVQQYQDIFNLNDTFMQSMKASADSCGYTDYIEKYLTFPASGQQPSIYYNASANASCNNFNNANDALFEVNPCFNIYEITQM
jgi:carboxypeptidase D